jgi:hypothetical protein
MNCSHSCEHVDEAFAGRLSFNIDSNGGFSEPLSGIEKFQHLIVTLLTALNINHPQMTPAAPTSQKPKFVQLPFRQLSNAFDSTHRFWQ